jgi:hypothetical protein
MTDPTVRKTKRADELANDDWVLDLASPTAASKVLTAYPYSDHDERVLVVYEDPDGRPATLHLYATDLLPLATFAEISAVSEDKRRYAVADQLRSLALLIDGTVLPMSRRYASNPKLEFHVDDLATVEYVADKLGVEIKVNSAGRHSAYYRPAGPDSLVVGEWFVYVEKAAESEPEPVAAPAEHHQSGGWKSTAPGTCGAECACGVTFDGFDTLAEAVELVERHIADPEGRAYSRETEDPAAAPVPDGVDGSTLTGRTPVRTDGGCE